MPFGDAKKVYCIEKNEIYPSISFGQKEWLMVFTGDMQHQKI